MTADQHLKEIQDRLSERGVINISLTLAPGAKDMPLEEVKMDVATFIKAFLDGKAKPVDLLDVEEIEDLAKRDGITLDEAKAKYDSVVLKTQPNPAVVRLKRKYVKKDKSINIAKSILDMPSGKNAMSETYSGTGTLVRPDHVWPFPTQIGKPNKPEDALL